MSTLSPESAELAIEIAEPSIQALLAQRWVADGPDAPGLHVMVARFTPNGNGDVAALAGKSFGNPAKWNTYAQIARAKAMLSARTGMDTRVVQTQHAELLEEGDTRYWGSVICGDLVVAASGVASHFDETICRIVLAICRGMLDQAFADLRVQAEQSSSFRYGS